MYDRAASHVADELPTPEKLIRRLIREEMKPQYCVISEAAHEKRRIHSTVTRHGRQATG